MQTSTNSTSESPAPARIALEDGSVFAGTSFGASTSDDPTSGVGEVVFNTAMCGYQEALTDPSYSGQILIMTAPMIGNYGINTQDMESQRPQIRGLVIREYARRHSNYRAETSLGEWLARHDIPAICDVDTRALVMRIREHGALRGAITTEPRPRIDDQALIEIARQSPVMSGRNLASGVTVEAKDTWRGDLGPWIGGIECSAEQDAAQRTFRVAALDCGGKHAIYRHLTQRGCEVIRFPLDATPEEIRAENPDGLFISNGPGDPAATEGVITTLRELVTAPGAGHAPLRGFGICLGHQLLALALGAKTFKLPFGHRGANQPVKNLLTGAVEITSQNHGFAVDRESLEAAGGEVTHINLNDNTVAGFRFGYAQDDPAGVRGSRGFAVQHHPEASPGPHDAAYLFDEFVAMLGGCITADAETTEVRPSS